MQNRRHSEILRILDAEGPVSNARLATALGVSAETVRRDVRVLADGGTVLRLHGGVGLAGQGGEAPFRARMRENAGAKQAIAQAFAATVQNGESLMLDTGTTTSFVARALVRHRRLTVVTNSTDIARTLAGGEGNRIYLAGGAVRPDSGAVLGPEAVRFVA
ncbi:MAG: DeoR/GlpR family DNA-binding transcription regulator, partial [Gemmobacter sp.]